MILRYKRGKVLTAVKNAAPLKKLVNDGAVIFLYLKRPGGVIGSLAYLYSMMT